MLEKENERNETISKTVRDHSRDETPSPQGYDSQEATYKQNRQQSDPTLVKVSLGEDDHLQSGGENRASTQSLALSLNVTAKYKFLDKTRGESQPQKGKRLNGILRNKRAESCAVVLERSQGRIRQIPDHCHHYETGKGDAEITSDRLPTTPFRPHQFLERDLSAATDADQCNGETYPQEGSQNETELQERSSMLRALRIDLSDREGSRPTQNKWKSKQSSKENSKIGRTGYGISQPPIYVDFHHTHGLNDSDPTHRDLAVQLETASRRASYDALLN
jgi:hypothetical protein